MKRTFFTSAMASIMLAVPLLFAVACGEGNNGKTQIYVDGGGANCSYNTTKSQQYDYELNRYPYKTLETLADEWNAMPEHSAYEVVIRPNSYDSDRESIVSLLNGKTAPDILYYSTTTIAEDMNSGWFADLTSYFDAPNKYSAEGENGSVKWSDIYTDSEMYQKTFAPNGKKYTVELEQQPVGMVYNKNYVSDNEVPETFDAFMLLQDSLKAENASNSSFLPYFEYYPWYDMAIESAVYSSMISDLDVISVDGVVNGEELVRGYMLEEFSPVDDYGVETIRLVNQLTKYFPNNFPSLDPVQTFLQGNVAMFAVTGAQLREIIDTNRDFEIGVMGFPLLRGSESGTGDYFSKYEVTGSCRRGMAGYTTAWTVTNSAMEKGQEAVDMCVDFLQYITEPDNNERLVNDKGYSVPLSGNSEDEYYLELMSLYGEDKQDGEMLGWAAMCAKSNMTKAYYDTYRNLRKNSIAGKPWSDSIDISVLDSAFQTSANSLYKFNNWNVDEWPGWGESNEVVG